MPSPTKDSPISWLDAESTGLDPGVEELIELAALVTTGPDYTPVDDGITVTIHPKRYAHLPPEEAVEQMRQRCVPVVAEMHTANGLFADIAAGRSVSLEEADILIQAYLASHVGPRESILGGNSITFDRGFLAVHAPKTFNHLHYRSLDCTSVAEFLRRHPSVDEAQELRPEAQGVAHRALADVRTSIAQARLMSSLLGAPLSV